MYSFNSRVRYSETGVDGRLSLTALLNYYQDCVTFHSDAAGLPLERLLAENMAWVLMSWQIELGRMPSLGEEITVYTSPYRIGGFTGLRSVWMCDAQGERLSAADSVWALLDTRTGRPTHVKPEFAEMYGLGERLELEHRGGPIRMAEDMEELPERVTVQAGMLDMNRHMNNAWYAHLAAERLPEGFGYSRLSVEYKRPAQLGDRLTVKRALDGQEATLAFLLDGAPCALARFTR